jgi:lysine 2,3-aminomutase
MLSDRRIEYLLGKLRAIPHVEIVRIHTRMPSQLPERVTPALCETIKRFHPVFVNVHFNHPDELTPATRTALAMLADAGCPLGSQTVLLKGVNDDPAIMKQLMLELLKCRVRPYYLYQADLVAGGEHFRTSVTKGLEIIAALRGWTSGLAVPHFVIDAPGGGGKVPLLPDYVETLTDREIVLRNYAGETFRYLLPEPDERRGTSNDPDVPRLRQPTESRPGGSAPAARRRSAGTPRETPRRPRPRIRAYPHGAASPATPPGSPDAR